MCLNTLFIQYVPPVSVEHRDGTLFNTRVQWDVDEFMKKNYIEERDFHE